MHVLGPAAALAAARRRRLPAAGRRRLAGYVRAGRAQRARLRRPGRAPVSGRATVVARCAWRRRRGRARLRRDRRGRRARAAALPDDVSDFYVASPRRHARAGTPRRSAGEYLSAASLPRRRRAGARLRRRHALVPGRLHRRLPGAARARRRAAAPLRRLHAARLRRGPADSPRGARGSPPCSSSAIGWLYLLPQFQGAGLTLRTVTGAPQWVGALVVAVVVVLNVAAGGMRSITFVQAFQYWLKLTAHRRAGVFLLLAWRADGAPDAGRTDAAASRGRHHRHAARRRHASGSTVRSTSTCTGTLDGLTRRRAGRGSRPGPPSWRRHRR